MSDKDEFTEKFHEMRSRMTPPPELLSRLSASLEAPAQAGSAAGKGSTDVAAGPMTARASAAKPDTARKPSRPTGARKRSRIGLFSGGATAIVLASVMIVSGLASNTVSNTASPWPAWPDPVVVAASGGSGHPANSAVDATAYTGVYQALVATSQSQYGLRDLSGSVVSTGLPVPVADQAAGGMNTDAYTYTSASGTNVQVAGIDEGDIVKTDGSCLYVAKGRTVAVVTARGADSHQIATIEVAGLAGAGEIIAGPVMDMMIQDKTLVVLFHGFTDDVAGWSASWGDYLSLQASSLKAAFYDISDPGHPRFLSQVSQSGSYVDSRLTDGMLYLVSRYSVSPEGADPLQPVTYVPTVDPGDGPVTIDPGDIAVLPQADSASYSTVTAIDVATRVVTSELAVLGRTDTIYMSPTSLYLASARWSYAMLNPSSDGQSAELRVTIPGYEGYQDAMTDIVRIALNSGNLTVGADAVLPGTLINQFALDEQDGYLRAVTTRTGGDWTQVPGLWILDSSLDLVGSLPELATREQVQSVRFDGDTGYVVTFERVDPLFAIDLSDPTDPEVRSALKIPGFSSYLHPFGPGLLLGIGTDADASGRGTGLKLSMFDIADPYDVQEMSTVHIDADSTDVAYDHKAAFVDLGNGLIGFPTMTYNYATGVGRITWVYQIYTWTGTGFEQRSVVTLFHSEDGSFPGDTTTRAVLLAGTFYLLANSTVDAYNLDANSQIAHVVLT